MPVSSVPKGPGVVTLTGHARQELASKALDLAVGERHEVVALQEVEHTGAQKVHHDANVAAVVEAIPQVDAPIPVLLVVGLECLEHSELDSAGISVLLHRANNLDGNKLVAFLVACLDDLSEGTLAEKLHDLVCSGVRNRLHGACYTWRKKYAHCEVSSASGTTM